MNAYTRANPTQPDNKAKKQRASQMKSQPVCFVPITLFLWGIVIETDIKKCRIKGCIFQGNVANIAYNQIRSPTLPIILAKQQAGVDHWSLERK